MEYLASVTDMELVRAHMDVSLKDRPDTFPAIYRRLVQALRNRRGMPNAIGAIDRLQSVLHEFDHKAVLKAYSHDWGMIFDKVSASVKPKSRMAKDNPHNSWVVFCKGVISAAEYLDRFVSPTEFYQYVDEFTSSPNMRPALPFLMKHEIYGIGFALACDFLKEIGYSDYSKPDTHLIDIFSGLGLTSRSQLDVFRAVSLMATEVDETPYAVDKAFWLIGSGNLYLCGQKFDSDKGEFVQSTKRRWSSQ